MLFIFVYLIKHTYLSYLIGIFHKQDVLELTRLEVYCTFIISHRHNPGEGGNSRNIDHTVGVTDAASFLIGEDSDTLTSNQ